MMGYHMMGGGLIGFLIIGLVIYFIINMGRNNFHCGGGHTNHRRKEPIDILKERYAKGEVSEEEYNRKRNKLID
ncbi:SHOCT domain-containing protein [Clostridiisalibacter paucivorans]|uniref:SHOCT domain-containing protein n=1 Tax=Clostridiisalibacter paucivorans TaxID=408753 RepID=UPI0006863A8A|nr:SHOCT domain-containing protein [Clostridiisalibacter paucivorans]